MLISPCLISPEGDQEPSLKNTDMHLKNGVSLVSSSGKVGALKEKYLSSRPTVMTDLSPSSLKFIYRSRNYWSLRTIADIFE